MKKIVGNNEELKIIMDEIERLNQEKYFGGLYDAEEEHRKMENTARLYGLEEGRNIGLEEGARETSKEIAVNLLKENIDISIISKATNLSIEDIQNLNKLNII